MYNIKVSKPFEDKYYKCKVLTLENSAGYFVTLYYFYNEANGERIKDKIISQLGMVVFD